MSRRTRTLLQTTEVCLQPKIITGVPETIRHQKQRAKQQYDKTAKPLPQLQIGQPIRLQTNNHNIQWKQGRCVDTDGSRSYLIELENGQVLRRNRKHLRASTLQTENNASGATVQPPAVSTSNSPQDEPVNAQMDKPKSPTNPAVIPPSPGKSSVKSTCSRFNINPPSKYKDFVLK